MDKALILQLEEKYSESREIEERLNLVEQQTGELKSFEESLDSLDKSNQDDILAPLGKGVFLPAKIKDKMLFISVGAGIFIRKSPAAAKKIVKEQIEGMASIKEELYGRMEALQREMQDIVGKMDDIK